MFEKKKEEMIITFRSIDETHVSYLEHAVCELQQGIITFFFYGAKLGRSAV